jgi:hypothetical protein
LVVFDPVHYEVGPRREKTIRARFLAHPNPEEVTIMVFLQETPEMREASEYYKFHVVYEDDED